MEFVLIPASRTETGRELDPFLMSSTEVTVEQYRAFASATGYVTIDERRDCGLAWDKMDKVWRWMDGASWRNPGFDQYDDSPVVGVNWYDAVAFCIWLSAKEGRWYTLPSENEWEHACRAGSCTAFYFGQTIAQSQANYDALRDSESKGYPGRTVPVGSFLPNAFGLYDMHGNALEWCRNLDVMGRAQRGGSWASPADRCASGCQDDSQPATGTFTHTGFRLITHSCDDSEMPSCSVEVELK
jgi:formylglycine-generating enzyme required for sulfatase activity